MSLLADYRALVAKVDATCVRIQSKYAAHIACKKGCGDCCRNITVFPVEAAAIGEALRLLSPDALHPVHQIIRKQADTISCPLLNQGRCLVYEARPIICRTHGMPILVSDEDGSRIDVCPKNFQNLSQLPMSDTIDLNRLNEMLWAINALFVKRNSEDPQSVRIPIADAAFRAL